MPLVHVKQRFQITLPADVRRRAKISIGDVLDAVIDGDDIRLRAKNVVDRSIAAGRADYAAGRFEGPFDTAEQGIDALHRGTKKGRRK